LGNASRLCPCVCIVNCVPYCARCRTIKANNYGKANQLLAYLYTKRRERRRDNYPHRAEQIERKHNSVQATEQYVQPKMVAYMHERVRECIP
jgi:hypothetical protein